MRGDRGRARAADQGGAMQTPRIAANGGEIKWLGVVRSRHRARIEHEALPARPIAQDFVWRKLNRPELRQSGD
jgi:hypothetical protein